MEVNTEADDIDECSHDDQPATGVIGLVLNEKWLGFLGVNLITLEGEISVRPQKVCPITMKFGVYIEVDEWCMTVCHMTPFKVKVTSNWNSTQKE